MQEVYIFLSEGIGYWLILAAFLGISYLCLGRTKGDERSRIRLNNRFKSIQKEWSAFARLLDDSYYDSIFRKVGLPFYITSFRYNLFRLIYLVVIIISIVLKLAFNIGSFSVLSLILFATLPIIMEVKKPFPMYYLLLKVREHYNVKKNNEVYLLFNEILSEFSIRGEKIGNMYHFIKRISPYYTMVRPALDKTLPLLRDGKHAEAWSTFALEVGTDEALTLSIIMKDVESASIEEANSLLEGSRSEFANSIYNSYKDYLIRRKNKMYFIVLVGAMFVLMIPFSAFYMWYVDVMRVANSIR